MVVSAVARVASHVKGQPSQEEVLGESWQRAQMAMWLGVQVVHAQQLQEQRCPPVREGVVAVEPPMSLHMLIFALWERVVAESKPSPAGA